MNDSLACDGKIALFNLTGSVGGSASFVLKPGDHPYIRKESDINFGDGILTQATLLERNIKSRLAAPHADMDGVLLEKIARVAANHPAVSGEIKKLITEFWKF
jgi:hypothetical protein